MIRLALLTAVMALLICGMAQASVSGGGTGGGCYAVAHAVGSKPVKVPCDVGSPPVYVPPQEPVQVEEPVAEPVTVAPVRRARRHRFGSRRVAVWSAVALPQ